MASSNSSVDKDCPASSITREELIVEMQRFIGSDKYKAYTAKSAAAAHLVADEVLISQGYCVSGSAENTLQPILEDTNGRVAWIAHLRLEAHHLDLKEREHRLLGFVNEEYVQIAESCVKARNSIKALILRLERLPPPVTGSCD